MVLWFWFFVACATIGYSPVLTRDWTIFDTIDLARNLTKLRSRARSGRNIYDDLSVQHTRSNMITPTIAQAKYYVHFAAVAYCNEPVLSKWSCNDCLAVGTGPDIQYVTKFNNRTANTRAFAAIRHSRKEIILSYRGTINWSNIKQDFTGDMIHIPNGNGTIQVHQGAWEAMISIHDELTETLRTLIEDYPDYKNVILTGHSLGGMMASLALFKFKTTPEFSNLSYSLYTYGQARNGNMDFALWVNSQNIKAIRVVSGGDTIPHLALTSHGYVHHQRELWIHNGKNKFCADDLVEDPKCSNSLGPNYNMLDHFVYWNVRFAPPDCILANPLSYVRNIYKK